MNLLQVFEHKIDLGMYVDCGLTPEFIWTEIERYVHHPEAFNHLAQGAKVKRIPNEMHEEQFERVISLGKVKVEEFIVLEAPSKMTIRIQPTKQYPASRFELNIEMEEQLAITFTYFEIPQNLPAQLQGLREQAWVAKDREFVQSLLRHFSS